MKHEQGSGRRRRRETDSSGVRSQFKELKGPGVGWAVCVATEGDEVAVMRRKIESHGLKSYEEGRRAPQEEEKTEIWKQR